MDTGTEGLLQSIFITCNSTLVFAGLWHFLTWKSASSPTQTTLLLWFPWTVEAPASLSLFQIISGQLWVEKPLTVPLPGWRTRRWMLTRLVFLHAPTRVDASLWVPKITVSYFNIHLTKLGETQSLSALSQPTGCRTVSPLAALPPEGKHRHRSSAETAASSVALLCHHSNLLKHQTGLPLVNNQHLGSSDFNSWIFQVKRGSVTSLGHAWKTVSLGTKRLILCSVLQAHLCDTAGVAWSNATPVSSLMRPTDERWN